MIYYTFHKLNNIKTRFKSSCFQAFYGKAVLKNLANSHGLLFVELEAYVFNFTKKEATVGVPQKSIFLEHLREAASLLSCHEEV